MNWDDLRYLVVIGREGTLAAAARCLKVDQTTVARRLRGMEKDLGTPLFERGEGGWQPTALGARVLERVARIEEDVASLTCIIEAGAQVVAGKVRITSVSWIVTAYLIPRLLTLYDRHPDLAIELIASNDNLSVARRSVDIAIRLARPESGDFLIRKLADVGFATYAARSGPRAPSGDWVTYGDDLAHTPEMRWLSSRIGDERVRLRSNSVHGLVRAVASGVGQGILPCFLADANPGLTRLSGPEPVLSRDLWLLVHADARQQVRVAATTAWLTERFAADTDAFLGRMIT